MEKNKSKKTVSALSLIMILMIAIATSLFSGCGKDSGHASCRDILDACRKIAPEGSFDTLAAYGEELYDDSFDSLYGIQFKDISDGAIL